MKKRTFKFRVAIKDIAKVEKEVVLEFHAPDLDVANTMLKNFCKNNDVELLNVIRVVII